VEAALKRGFTKTEFRFEFLSGRAFLPPIAQLDKLLDLSSFVSVFLGLRRTVVRLAEGMLRVSYDLGDCIYGLSHTDVFLS